MKTHPVQDDLGASLNSDPVTARNMDEQDGQKARKVTFHGAGDTVVSAIKFRKKKGRLGKFLKNYSHIKGLISEKRRIDYVLVHSKQNPTKKKKRDNAKEDTDSPEHRRELFENAIRSEGLEIHEDTIGDFVYKKLHCPFARLCIEAEKTRLELPLKDMEIKKPADDSLLSKFWELFETDTTDDFDSAPFDLDRIEKFQNYKDPTKFFRPALRSLLTHHILINIDIGRSIGKAVNKDDSSGCFPFLKSRKKAKSKPEAEIEKDKQNEGIRKRGLLYLMMKEDYSDAYILHDDSEASQKKEKSDKLGELTTFLDDEVTSQTLQDDARKDLDERWSKFYKFQPLWMIRDYFGEQIALYFAWSGTLITTIYLPTLVGFIVFLYGLVLSIKKNEELLDVPAANSTIAQVTETVQNIIVVIRESFDNNATPWFAFIICLWGLLYLMMKEDYSDAYILHDDSEASQKKEKSDKLGELTTFLDDEVTSQTLQDDARKDLDERWSKFYKFQPLWMIRDYFGEQIALYFAWSGTLITTIYLPTLVGFIVFLYGLVLSIKKNEELLDVPAANSTIAQVTETVQNIIVVIRESFDNNATPWFAFIICLWGTIFLEYWKRRNAVLAYEWDVDDFEDNQPDRPQFYGKVKQDPITKEFHLFYPFKKKLIKLLASGSALMLMVMLVLISVIAVIVYRVIVSVDVCPDMSASSCIVVSTIFSSVFNAVSILILGRIYEKLAVVLTDWENYRTQTDYDDALIIKLFCFQFVNSYASCFYIAFFRGRFDESGILGRGSEYSDSCIQSCMSQLSFQVLVLMLMKPFPKLFKDIVLPVLIDKFWIHRPEWCCRSSCCKNNQVNEKNIKRRKSMSDKELRREKQRAFLVKERLKPPIDDFTLSEYTEKVIQYGFLMLFTASFPLAPLIALVTNYIDIRVDAKRLLWLNRRPIAFIAQDIGTWYSILQFVNFCGVVSNGFIIGFTSTWANNNYPDLSSRLWIVMLFEHAVFAIKFLLAYLIPDVPAEVKLAIRREKFNVRKIMAEGKYDLYKKKRAKSSDTEKETDKKPKRGLQSRLSKNHLDPDYDFVREPDELEYDTNRPSTVVNMTDSHGSDKNDGAVTAVDTIDNRGELQQQSTVWSIKLPENRAYESTSYV